MARTSLSPLGTSEELSVSAIFVAIEKSPNFDIGEERSTQHHEANTQRRRMKGSSEDPVAGRDGFNIPAEWDVEPGRGG